MRRALIASAIGSLTATVLLAGSPATADELASWEVTDVPVEYGNLVAVDVAPGDAAVAAAGFAISEDFAFSPLVVVRDGDSWDRQRVRVRKGTGETRFDDVDLRSGRRGWAVGSEYTGAGSSPFVGRWNGKRWKASTLDEPGLLGLLGVATAGRHVWAVGQDQVGFSLEPLIMHRRKDGWSRIGAPPLEDVGQVRALTSVAAAARDDVWAVGTGGIAIHYDGDTWAQTAVPKIDGKYVELSRVRVLGPGDVWAVGYVIQDSGARTPAAMRWNGAAWAVVDTPHDLGAQLNDVTRTRGGGTLAVGYTEAGGIAFYGLRLFADGAAKPLALPDGHDALFGAAASATEPDLWVVGSGAVGAQGFIAPYAAVRR